MSATAAFVLLALLAELTGRSITFRLDRALHVQPLATPTTRYYPFLLAGVRALGAAALAAVLWRLVRAHALAAAADRLRGASGRRPQPRLSLRLSPRLWAASFGATAGCFLLQNDAGRVSDGRWPLLAPWLHTYALGVFAVLSALLAVAWAAVRDWLADVEQYAYTSLARARAMLAPAEQLLPRRGRRDDDRAPRHLFGLAFESRPPPLTA